MRGTAAWASKTLVASAFACAPTLARAAEPEEKPYALDYAASATATSCGDEAQLRARVAERVGRDPFASGNERGARTLRVRVTRDKASARGWVGEIVVVGKDGATLGKRTLAEGGASCDALARSLAFTIAVLLEEAAPPPEPPASAQPTSPSTSAPEPSPFDDDRRPVLPPPTSASPRGPSFDASAGVGLALGIAPSPSTLFEAQGGVGFDRARIELGARATLPSSNDEAVSVRTRLVVGRVAPCYGLPIVSGCLVATLGSVSGEAAGSGVASTRLDSAFYAHVGAGAVSRVFVGDVFFVRVSIEVGANLTRTNFDVGRVRAWSLPPIGGAASVGIGARFR